jgi:hypothetical protein
VIFRDFCSNCAFGGLFAGWKKKTLSHVRVIKKAFQGILSTIDLHVAFVLYWQWVLSSHMTLYYQCFSYTYCAVCIGPSQDRWRKRRDGAIYFNSVVLCWSLVVLWACVWLSVYMVVLKSVVSSVLLHVTHILNLITGLCVALEWCIYFDIRLLMMVLVALLIVNCACLVMRTACVLVMRHILILLCDVMCDGIASHNKMVDTSYAYLLLLVVPCMSECCVGKCWCSAGVVLCSTLSFSTEMTCSRFVNALFNTCWLDTVDNTTDIYIHRAKIVYNLNIIRLVTYNYMIY